MYLVSEMEVLRSVGRPMRDRAENGTKSVEEFKVDTTN